MKVKNTTQIKITIKHEDVDCFKTAIKKIVSESKKVGFKNNILTDEEKTVLTKLSENL